MCSCQNRAILKAFEPVKAFTSSFCFEQNDRSFTVSVTCNSYEDIRLTFTSPQTLNGFSVRTSNGELITSTGDIEDSFPAQYAGSNSPVSLILSGIQAFVFGNNSTSVNADGNILTWALVGNREASAIFSPEGELLSISVPSADFFTQLV